MSYRYLALNKEGEQTRGVLDVASEEAAERALWQRELTILGLEPVRRRLDLVNLFPSLLGPKARDVILFSRQFATLVDSGVALTAALELLSSQINSRALARAVNQVQDDLRIGTSLSKAMAKHPLAFPELYCRMIEVGERSGNLGQVLNQLAAYMERTQVTLAKVRGAMSYPAFILALAVVVVLILLNVALPPMTRLFEEFGAQLPWPTLLLMGVAQFLTDHGLKLFWAAAVLSLLGWAYASRPSGRRRLHRIGLSLPLVGKVSIHGAVARLSRTLSILVGSGLALPEALELSRQTVGNVVLREALDEVRQEALQGRGLSRPLAAVRYFPRMLSYLVRIGEETGTLDSHLATAADFYEKEVDRALNTMTAVLEPALIIGIGLLVGFVAISVVLPMYDLLGAIQ
jgi:type IV pilus assembly protein PilC